MANASSPYLQQHGDNPVDWYPWSEAAFQKAKRDSKLIIVSIGYSACHWCHVMEHESFMDSTVAAVMNEHFVSIKVDREQRPDVDDIYMNAAHMTTGRGGWPLNAIALPNGKPVVAGTYFPRQKWIRFLKRINREWEQNPEKLQQQADNVANSIRQRNRVAITPRFLQKKFTVTDLDTLWKSWQGRIDYKRGGDKGRMKFPKPNNWQFLLRYHYLTGNEKALEAVNVTLQHMAKGGIHDHIGGGFARYSTDKYWKVPHFEKMLYDNAQLMKTYAEAYKFTQNPLYKEVVYKMDEFIRQHMLAPEGGFYSSLNADSEGEEGKFYVWTYDQLAYILSESELNLFSDYYNVTKSGNWDHDKNVLHRTNPKKVIAQKHDMTVETLDKKMNQLEEKVFNERKKRTLPSKDTKILAEWNALMLKGYVDAYEAFGEKRFLRLARQNAEFLDQKMITDSFMVYRDYKDGEVNIEGFLDDYSFTIEAFIALYQVTFEEKWLYKAKHLMEYVMKHFYDQEKRMFYYASDENATLISRKVELQDNVIPAANSSIAKGLYLLSQYFYQDHKDYRDKAQHMLSYIQPNMPKAPDYFTNWGILMTHFIHPPYEVAIVGRNFSSSLHALQKHFLPHVIYLGGKKEGTLTLLQNKYVEGTTRIYVCQNKTCRMPVEEVSKALQQIERPSP